MNQPNLNWFYFHILLASIIIVKDYNGTLEESLDRFEKSVGLYTEIDTTEYEEPPYYIPPIDDGIPIDSTFAIDNRVENE
jgi:hypothetical protein